MAKILTEEQIQQYHQNGFVSPIRVMSEEEANSIKVKIEEAEKSFLKISIQKSAIIYTSLLWYWMIWLTTILLWMQ